MRIIVPVNKVYRPVPSSRRQAQQKQSHQRQNQPKVTYKTKKSHFKRNILIGLGLSVVSMMSAAAGAILAVTLSESSVLQQANLTVEEEQIFNKEETVARKNLALPELSRPVNILVLGIKVLTSDLKDQPVPEDLGYHALVNSFDGLSDSMLVIRLDPQKEKLSVLSVPRDTKVNLEGYGNRKINHANEYGGPALAASTVSELLGGVPIDRYVRVNVQGVEKLIDALGGVNMFVPKDMKYNDFSQHLYIDLKKGQQHLDGEKAVQFLRYRYDGLGDISRVQRQQLLMRAVTEQALRPATVIKVPKILDIIKSHIDTNLTVKELMALSNFAANTERSDVQMVMLPGDFNNPEERVSYWIPNQRRINQITNQHFAFDQTTNLDTDGSLYGQNISPRDFTTTRIAIQNSLEDPRVARKMLSKLKEAGYHRSYISQNWAEPLKVTKIVAQTGDTIRADALKNTLGIGEVLVESTGSLRSDVTIQIGEDWQDYLNIQKLE